MIDITRRYSPDEYGLQDYIEMLPGFMRRFLSGPWSTVTDDMEALEEMRCATGLAKADSIIVFRFTPHVDALLGAELCIGSPENLLHEAGHLLDAMLGGSVKGASDASGFRLIYSREKDRSGFSAYLTGNPYEYFAEAFSDYILDENKADTGRPSLRERCPDTAAYIYKALSIAERRWKLREGAAV